MYNYLIADYILGYSLSSDSLFSASDIARELNMRVGPISIIFIDLCKLNEPWFEIINKSSGSEMKIRRRKEYDDEIIQWLINGESKNYYKETEMIGSSYYAIKTKPVKSPVFSFKSIFRVIAFISTREVKKDKKWAIKYIFSIKHLFRKTSKK